jgi:protocatechuate 3,4-dioxygenase beta subunit
MYIGMPSSINEADTSAGWREPGQQLLVKGTVYQRDGKTPAADIVIYYWQTDHAGYYSPWEGMPEKAKPHGHIRGWLKTDKNGKYTIYTVRPAPYPNENMPAHIHLLILEPGIGNPYYIDDFVFDDDPLVTDGVRRAMENRGGSGILRARMEGRLQVVEPVTTLGLNIPGYPAAQ